MRGWPSYWAELIGAFHMLGEHEKALESAIRGCELYPNSYRMCLWYLPTSLASLGRGEEAIAVFADLESSSVVNAQYLAECLLGHGHADAARQLLERVVSWLEGRPEEEKRTADHRVVYGRALANYGRVEEARRVFDSLVDEDPGNVDYRGNRGFIGAMAGDSMQAMRDAEWLAALDRMYLRGDNTFWRAAIACALGERDEAVDLLRQAYSEGLYHRWWYEWTPLWSPIRDYPPFQELMRPKG
jgi:tetratricopeptide (TPR) repeat protein